MGRLCSYNGHRHLAEENREVNVKTKNKRKKTKRLLERGLETGTGIELPKP
jgi:hypothetical protein